MKGMVYKMSVFTSNRPENTDVALERISKLRSDRKNNLKAVTEEFHDEAEAKAKKELLDKQDKEIEEKELVESTLILASDRRLASIKKQKLALLEKKLVDDNKDELFNQVIFEMVYNAYWLDDAVKENTDINVLYEAYNNIKDTVSKVVAESTTPFIDEVKNVIQSICEKSAARITKEVEEESELKSIEDLDKVNFNLSDIEEINLSDNLNELGKEDIEQLVKDKVLTVVQDEKQAGEQKQNMFKEIDDSVKAMTGDSLPTDDTTGESGTNESFIAGSTRNLRNRFRRGVNGTVFETLMIQSNKALSESIATEGLNVSKEAKASAVFTDTVFKYTVLETLHTVGLYKFEKASMESVINALKNM